MQNLFCLRFQIIFVSVFTARCYALNAERARICHGKSSVCPSVRDVEVSWSYRLEYFENNFFADLPRL